MRYNLNFGKSFKKTTKGLDGIIEALTYPPEPPPNPKTVVTYENGDVVEYLIEGELGQNLIPNKRNAVRVDIGTAVTSIGANVFNSCSKLTSITILDSVTKIGDSAFLQCSGLTSVTFPNSLTKIGANAFTSCSRLTSVTIPDSVTSIGMYAFSNCSGLTEVTADPRWGTRFSGPINLVFTIPDSVTSIGSFAFEDCSWLTFIVIPDSVTSIESYAFSGCTALSSITSLRTSAPTVQSNTFGNSDSNYTGRNTYSTGDNVLKVPQGATGYDSSYWLDQLQNATKCGFHIEYI